MENKRFKKYLDKAIEIYENKYDYSEYEYVNCKTDSTIICPIHGKFQMSMDVHINYKRGCPKCGKRNTYDTTEEWVEKANEIHNNKYDYSKTVYTKSKDKVTVICHEIDEDGVEHGEFSVRACNHIYGIGCPKCGHRYQYNTEEFIKKARKIHGDKYDYSEAEYSTQHTPLTIICPTHGRFRQLPSVHIFQHAGCPKCNGGVVFTKEDFIEKAREIHGDRYDYGNVEYKNAREPVEIICKTHGSFYQTPDVHLRGNGCPKCRSSRLESMIIKLFKKENINYIYEYKLDKGISQRCDFFLPDYNVVIECQGEQHFIPTSFNQNAQDDNTKLKSFERTRLSDSTKYNECINRGMKVVYFTLTDYFHEKFDVSNDEFYKDKLLFTHTDQIMEYINSLSVVNYNKDTFDMFCDAFKEEISDEFVKHHNILKYHEFNIVFQPLERMTKQDELNDKRRERKKRDVNIILVFEDEFVNNKTALFDRLKDIMNIYSNDEPINVSTVEEDKALDFLKAHCLDGDNLMPSLYYVACYNSLHEIVAVLSFDIDYRILIVNSFACDMTKCPPSVRTSILRYLRTNFEWKKIKLVVDKRWLPLSEEQKYEKLGFVKEKSTFPRVYRFNAEEYTRKPIAVINKSEENIMYDCGVANYYILNEED